jgi:hypothetical protein
MEPHNGHLPEDKKVCLCSGVDRIISRAFTGAVGKSEGRTIASFGELSPDHSADGAIIASLQLERGLCCFVLIGR